MTCLKKLVPDQSCMCHIVVIVCGAVCVYGSGVPFVVPQNLHLDLYPHYYRNEKFHLETTKSGI